MRLLIKGGRVIDPASGLDRRADVAVADGRVIALGEAPSGFEPGRTIHAEGQVVCPGLVDLRANLREPGQEHKATIASETRAAAASGITTLCCTPDTEPVVDTPAVVELIHQRATDAGTARVEVLGALTQGLAGERLAEQGALAAAGCVGLSNANREIVSTEVLRRALEYAATVGLPVFLHVQDPWLGRDGHAHEGTVSTRLGLPGIPETAETISLSRALLLVELTGVSAHFCHLSSARSVELLGEAQSRGLPVTGDVAAHQLHLTEMDLASFNANFHLCPPLRTERDREGLRNGLRTGTLSAICSDHLPHEPDAKCEPFPATELGMSSLETLLPLTLRLVEDGVLELMQALAALTSGPAQLLGLDAGAIRVGRPADLCIFDPSAHWTLHPGALISRGQNTGFAGWDLLGRVTHTVLGGRVVYPFAD